jgi:hypothetical protein
MAKIYDQHLGRTRGKVGDVIFKVRGKNSFVGKSPKKYKTTKEEGAIFNRNRFSMLTDFASAVNDSPELKALWKSSKYKGNIPFRKIFKENFVRAGDNFMKITARIVPGELKFNVTKVTFNPSAINVYFNVIEDIVNKYKAPYVFMGFLQLSNPVNKPSKNKSDNRKFVTIEYRLKEFSFKLNKINKISFKDINKGFKLLNDYQKVIFHFAIISKPKDKTPLSTYSEGVILKGEDIYFTEYENAGRIKNTVLNKKTPVIAEPPDLIIRIK